MPLNRLSQPGACPGSEKQSSFFGSSHPPWAECVRSVVDDLETLNRATEKDFLAIGGNLMTFLSDSRGLHADIEGLTALVSGEQAGHACHALGSVRFYVQELQGRSAEGGRVLLVLQAAADRIRRGFSSFGQIVLSFHTAAIAAKIEVAYLADSQQNLGTLADEVCACSEGIRERVDRILDVAAAFDARIAATLREVSRFEAIQIDELPSLLAAVDADVDVFQTRQREAVEGSLKLAAELDSVARELGAVATSIQFHDITRQQIEHVTGALQGLLREAQQGEISSSAANLVKLQRRQLESAAAAFAHSTEKIDRDLESISERVGEMAAASHCLHSIDHGERGSFFDGMQRRFAGIARAVSELHSLEHATRATVADLRETGRGLGDAVNEVRSIESRLGLISINAAISAHRLGARGKALEVIADAIRELKDESASRSGDAREALESIRTVLLRLGGNDAPGAADNAGSILLGDLNTRVSDLQSAGASGADAAAHVGARAEHLRSSLRYARDRFEIGPLFADTVNRCCDLLGSVASQAPASPSSGRPALEQTGEDLYTMEAERKVHRALTGETTPLPLEAGSDASPVEECGEEVEFF